MCFLWRGVVSTSPNPQAGGPPLISCPQLLIQFIHSYPPYWRPFLHPQPEDAPCHGDRDPHSWTFTAYWAKLDMSLGNWAHAIRTEEILPGMWLTRWMTALSLYSVIQLWICIFNHPLWHCAPVKIYLLNFIILRISVLCIVPIHPVFPGTVLFLKEISQCSENFSCGAWMSHFFIW